MTADKVSISTTPYAPASVAEWMPLFSSPRSFGARYDAMGIRRAVERASTQVEQAGTGMLSLLRECWRRMGLMKLSFEHAELSDGTGSRERSAERRRDEDDWARMDDEGCSNYGSQPTPGRTEPSRTELVTRVG